MEAGMIRRIQRSVYAVSLEGGGMRECTARGVFRKDGIIPLAGDRVEIEGGVIARILPRKNEILRLPTANVDLAVLVVSTVQPAPNLLVLDKLIAVCESKGIEPILVFTKNDLAGDEELEALYCQAGFRVFRSALGQKDYGELLKYMAGKLSVFIGNSGVGKSTLMNSLIPNLQLLTAQISDKLGRGRHTTRHVELYDLPGGGLAADTPGFSTVELDQYGWIRKEELAGCFREFGAYTSDCRFPDCSHRREQGCAVLSALAEGKISLSRHQNYCALYEKAMQVKEWERKGERKSR